MPRRGNGVFTRPRRPDAADACRDGVFSAQGFNKNVTAYVTKGREALAKVPGGDFTLVHHNAYKSDELGECFERNAEGMLKNMAIHELALLVTFFGVNSDTLSDVVADKNYSDLRTEKGPSSGSDFTDFSRIGFTVTTKAGAKVSVYADRCGLELPDGAMADGGMMYSSVSKLGALAASRRVEAPPRHRGDSWFLCRIRGHSDRVERPRRHHPVERHHARRRPRGDGRSSVQRKPGLDALLPPPARRLHHS